MNNVIPRHMDFSVCLQVFHELAIAFQKKKGSSIFAPNVVVATSINQKSLVVILLLPLTMATIMRLWKTVNASSINHITDTILLQPSYFWLPPLAPIFTLIHRLQQFKENDDHENVHLYGILMLDQKAHPYFR